MKGEFILAVQLSDSYLRRAFQLVAKITPSNISNDEAFDRASTIVYDWARKKFSKIFREMPLKKETLDYKRTGNEIGIIYEPNKEFIFRATHPDVSVPGRMWITDVELIKIDKDYFFAIKLSVSSLQSCTEEVPFSRPQFVQEIINNVGISDIFTITDQENTLSTQEDVDKFVQFLADSQRQMPAILLTPCYRIEDAEYKEYIMNASKMAQDLQGVAHIFLINQEANEYLTKCIGKEWSAYNGAIRTYYPKLSFKESDYYQHPLLIQQRINIRKCVEKDASLLYMHEIEEYVQRYTLAQNISWENYGIYFYLTAHQNILRVQREASNQSRQQLINSYEEQLDQLQKQCDENMSLADSYAKDFEICNNENESQRQLINQLRAQITTLRFQLMNVTGGETEKDIPEDKNYDNMSEWVKTHYSDRLILLSRAERNLKDACFEDVTLVYKCLKLLATSYYDYRKGSINYDQFSDECKKINPGLEESGAITDVSAGMQGDTYYVMYHGKKQKLERHLTKGSNKDKRYCLRIYFFWDEQDQIVVIGDMPHHLDTTAT